MLLGLVIGFLLVDLANLADDLGAFEMVRARANRSMRQFNDWLYVMSSETEARLRKVREKHEAEIVARFHSHVVGGEDNASISDDTTNGERGEYDSCPGDVYPELHSESND